MVSLAILRQLTAPALRFMRQAERLDPAQGICVLILLEKLGRKEEAETYADRFLGEHSHGTVAALVGTG